MRNHQRVLKRCCAIVKSCDFVKSDWSSEDYFIYQGEIAIIVDIKENYVFTAKSIDKINAEIAELGFWKSQISKSDNIFAFISFKFKIIHEISYNPCTAFLQIKKFYILD